MIFIKLNQSLLKIQELLEQRGWSLYKLAKVSDIPYSSLNSLFLKNNQPTISTLEKICDGFCITMSEFFSEDTPYRYQTPLITKDEQTLLDNFRSLSKNDQERYLLILDILKKTDTKK